ncbi:MAG: hypothetical protein PHE17_14125 [Thiothrix sp.]|uniref:hypothetical protein n=1 Tax=Thiothrix sp. TaxID=1032 RepID=UPI0026383203|nr:hypothetical protein [Thiothrix sp.]MDD5394146.1 hypothetical protein [Thiothrix sp.]
MYTKETYRQKLEAKLEKAQLELIELNARSRSAEAAAYTARRAEHGEIEQLFGSTKAKIKEIGDAWDKLKAGWGKEGET